MIHPTFQTILTPFSPGLAPPMPRELHLCACGEPLTLECEFDDDEALCMNCRAERALGSSSSQVRA